MNSVRREKRQVNGRALLMAAIDDAQAELLREVGREVSSLLVAAIQTLLHRLFYVRRSRVGRWVEEQGGAGLHVQWLSTPEPTDPTGMG